MTKNILLLGTCRTRIVFQKEDIFSDKYNLINNKTDYIGRSYSVYDTYELLRCIKDKKINILTDELKTTRKQFKRNLRIISDNFNDIDLFLIEISSMKYYTHVNDFMDSNILMSPNFGKVISHKLNTLDEEQMDYYFEKIMSILEGKKIIFMTHFNNYQTKNRTLIMKNLTKNVIRYKDNKNIKFLTPEKLLQCDNVNEYLKDGNHYHPLFYDVVAAAYVKLFTVAFE
jgi:hypothetical protein